MPLQQHEGAKFQHSMNYDLPTTYSSSQMHSKMFKNIRVAFYLIVVLLLQPSMISNNILTLESNEELKDIPPIARKFVRDNFEPPELIGTPRSLATNSHENPTNSLFQKMDMFQAKIESIVKKHFDRGKRYRRMHLKRIKKVQDASKSQTKNNSNSFFVSLFQW